MKRFPKILPPEPPTEEQMKAACRRWLEPLAPCLYPNWPEALQKLSFPTTVFPLTRAEADVVLDMSDGKGSAGDVLDALIKRLNIAIGTFGTRHCFYRLGSRSPKDFWGRGGAVAARSGLDILESLACSMRTTDDLCIWRYADEPPHLLLRHFQYLPPADEFRCLIKGGRVRGVSQYLHDQFFGEYEDAGHREDVRQQVLTYLDERVLPHLHVPDVVVDVCLMGRQVLLIELNPYGQSDPCLFTYADLETADRELRVATRNVVSVKGE